MDAALLLPALLALPPLTAALSLGLRSPRHILRVNLVGASLAAAMGALAAGGVLGSGEAQLALEGWLFLDALSALHLLLLVTVFLLSTAYARGYFESQIRAGRLDTPRARQFGALWPLTLGSLLLVLLSNNLGIMWVGLEATTVATAFLICLQPSSASLEAMWKYLLICSVGVGLAFLGTLFIAAAATGVQVGPHDALLWTTLQARAAHLDPAAMRVAFVFILVGYGTKAGLAPMHNWLPDAHSQAPGPVSALFSGFMLSAALYCVLRYLPLVEASQDHSGWALDLLLTFGLLSMLLAASFLPFQRDVKRLLAYSSVEHVGIVAVGVGLGGAGVFAALFHTLNHALAKPVAFFAAGQIGQRYGTHDMTAIRGSLRATPLWGRALLGALLALVGVAPFALFMSELQILQAAAGQGAWGSLILFLIGAGVVFVAALRYALAMAWGAPPELPAREPPTVLDRGIVLLPLLLLLVLGVWMPAPLERALVQAAAIIGGTR